MAELEEAGMREFIDGALTQYVNYMEKYGVNGGTKLHLEWKPLIMCLYLAVLPAGRQKFAGPEELLRYLETFLTMYYAEEDEEREGFVNLTGYMLVESSISCFSIYSLFIYMNMEELKDRQVFYRTMIELLFRYECIWGGREQRPGAVAQKYLSDELKSETVSSTTKTIGQNSGEIRKTFREYVKLKRYEENVKHMEIAQAETDVVEAYFM